MNIEKIKKIFTINKFSKTKYNKIEESLKEVSINNLNNTFKNFNFYNPLKKLKIIVKTIICALYFSDWLKDIKLYGSCPKILNYNYKEIKKFNNLINFNTNIKRRKREKIHWTIFNPKGYFFIFWNIIMIFLILYSLIYLPFGIVFYPNSTDIFDYVINVFFVFDILFNFNTAYIDNKKNLETSRKKIVINYLKGYFLIDFISSIPFELFLTSDTNSANKLLRILKMPRLIRMIKISKIGFLKKLLENFPEFSYKLKIYMGIINIIKLFLFSLLMIHLAACLWAFIGFNDEYTYSWIYRANISLDNKFNIYIASIYFCFVTLTTVGYGDILPHNRNEIIFTIFWMMVGVSFYSLIIGLINSFFQNKESMKTLLTKKINTVENFCSVNKIDKILKKKIIKNLKFSSSKISYLWLNKNYSIFDFLNLQLKYEFLKKIYKKLVNNNPFFYEKNISFIVKILPLLKPLKYEKGEYIWKINEFANSLIFITEGEVDFYFLNPFYNYKKKIRINTFNFKITNQYTELNDKNNIKSLLNKPKIVFKTMSNGSYFGEEEIINDKRRYFDIIAKNNWELFILSRNDFEKIVIKEYPKIYNEIKKQSQLKMKKNLEWIEQTKDYLKEFLGIKSNENFDNHENVGWNNFTVLEKYNIEKYKKKRKLNVNDFYEKVTIKNCFEELIDPISVDIDKSVSSKNSKEIKSIGLKKIVNKWNLILNNLKNKNLNNKENKISLLNKKKSRIAKRFSKNSRIITRKKTLLFNKNYEYIFNNLIELRRNVNKEIFLLDEIDYKLSLLKNNLTNNDN